MDVRGYLTDSAKVVQASTDDWPSATAAGTTPQVCKFDTLGYRGALVLVNTGIVTGDNEVVFTLTQSDAESGEFAAIAGTQVEAFDGASYQGQLLVYDVADLSKRWLAVNAVKTPDEDPIDAAFSVTAILYKGDVSPVANATDEAAGVFVVRVPVA